MTLSGAIISILPTCGREKQEERRFGVRVRVWVYDKEVAGNSRRNVIAKNTATKQSGFPNAVDRVWGPYQSPERKIASLRSQ